MTTKRTGERYRRSSRHSYPFLSRLVGNSATRRANTGRLLFSSLRGKWSGHGPRKINLLSMLRKSGAEAAANQMAPTAMSDTDAEPAPNPRYAEAYHKGYLAGRRGCTGADNPYENDSRDARAWIMGLLDGRTRQLTVVRSG